jgi:hypothetical protein
MAGSVNAETAGSVEIQPTIDAGSALAPGQVVRVRTRTYLVEAVESSLLDTRLTLVQLSCLDDDAQGQPLEVIWELELGTHESGWF